MAAPWLNDPVVKKAPWENDPVVGAPAPAAATPPPVAEAQPPAASVDWNGPFKTAPAQAQTAEDLAGNPILDAIKMSLQATGRGAADLAGAIVDVPYGVTNLGVAGVNKVGEMTGHNPNLPYAEVPFLGGKSAGETIADVFGGLAEKAGYQPAVPETPAEQNISKAVEWAASAAGGAGLLNLLAGKIAPLIKSGEQAPGIITSMVRPFLNRPVTATAREIGAGAGAAGGDSLAEKYLPDNPLARFLAALAGGVGGSSIASAAMGAPEALATGASKTFTLGTDKNIPVNPETGKPYTQAQSDLAARAMQASARDAPKAADTVAAEAAGLRSSGVPGEAMPTSGNLSGDPGVAALERRFRTQDGPAFIERDQATKGEAAQRVESLRNPAADQTAVNRRGQQAVDAAVAPARAGVQTAETAVADAARAQQAEGAAVAAQGGAMRGTEASRRLDQAVVDNTYIPARTQKNAMFDAVDPTRTEMVDAQPVLDAAARVRDNINVLGPQAQQLPAEFVRRIERLAPDIQADADGVPVNVGGDGTVAVGDLVDLRKYLSTARAGARQSGNFELADNLATLQDSIAEATAGHPAAAEAMRNYGENFAPTFRPGPGDEMAKFTKAIDRDGTRTSTAPENTAGRFLGAPEKSAALRRVLDASPSRAEGMAAVRDYMMNDFAGAVLNPDGSINPRRAAAWLDGNQSVLAPFPDVRSEVERMVAGARRGDAAGEAAKAQLKTAQDRLKTAESDAGASAAGTLMREDPRDVAEGLLSGKWNASKKIDEVNAVLGNDAPARDGWEAAFADVLANRVTNTKTVDGSFEASFAKLAQDFKQNEDIIAKVFPPEKMRNLKLAHKLLGYFKQGEARATSGSDTAEKMLMMSKGDEMLSGPLGRSVELVLKHVYGNLEGGGAMRRFRLMVSLLPTERYAAREIVQTAWFNPEVAAYLLGKPVRNIQAIPAAHGLRAAIAADLSGRKKQNDGENP